MTGSRRQSVSAYEVAVKPAQIGGVRWGARLGSVLDRTTKFSAAAAFAVTALSFFGSQWWFFELFTHFRLQLAGGAALFLAAALIRRHYVPASLAGAAAAVNLAFLLPYVMPQPPMAQAAPNAVRILVANVGKYNDDYRSLRDLVAAERPDIVGLLEADRGWSDALSDLSDRFRWRVLRPEEGAYGIVLLSRVPMRELPNSPYRREGVQAAVSVELDLFDAPATMVLAHLMAPLGPSFARLRNDQLADLAGLLQQDEHEARILVGDLNVTPWSPEYGVLERQTGLANAAVGRGYRGTWPVRPALLRIPIDHCLVSDAFEVAAYEVGPDVGSDHFPLIVDLVPKHASQVHSGE